MVGLRDDQNIVSQLIQWWWTPDQTTKKLIGLPRKKINLKSLNNSSSTALQGSAADAMASHNCQPMPTPDSTILLQYQLNYSKIIITQQLPTHMHSWLIKKLMLVKS